MKAFSLPFAASTSPLAAASAAPSSLTHKELATPSPWTLIAVTRQRLSKVLTTVTGKFSVAVLPELSVAVQTTVVVPIGKVESGGGLQATVTGPGALSVAV